MGSQITGVITHPNYRTSSAGTDSTRHCMTTLAGKSAESLRQTSPIAAIKAGSKVGVQVTAIKKAPQGPKAVRLPPPDTWISSIVSQTRNLVKKEINATAW